MVLPEQIKYNRLHNKINMKSTQHNFTKLLNEISGVKKISNNSYYLNIPNIMAVNQVIMTGRDYILFTYQNTSIAKIYSVKLLHVLINNSIVNLELKNNLTPEIFHIAFSINDDNPYYLIDLDCLVFEISTEIFNKLQSKHVKPNNKD
jgi:hypothetical protein